MPYITHDARIEIMDENFGIDLYDTGFSLDTSGELNYVITRIIKGYLDAKGHRYEHMNAILGVLDAASKEFYRRVVSPYEDKKIAENGDVY